mmetsp:Transcript_17386/g.51435  ORF Transcript_17386/g.51435 Transcript_17386/m.51435 type:complete len:319 (+) Transcript_17386:385-1341(+)
MDAVRTGALSSDSSGNQPELRFRGAVLAVHEKEARDGHAASAVATGHGVTLNSEAIMAAVAKMEETLIGKMEEFDARLSTVERNMLILTASSRSAVCHHLISTLRRPDRDDFRYIVNYLLRPIHESGDALPWPMGALQVVKAVAQHEGIEVLRNFTLDEHRALLHALVAILRDVSAGEALQSVSSIAAMAGACIRRLTTPNAKAVLVANAGSHDVNGVYVTSSQPQDDDNPLEFFMLFSEHPGPDDQPNESMSIRFFASPSPNVGPCNWRIGAPGNKSYACRQDAPASRLPPRSGWKSIRGLAISYGRDPPPRVYLLE